jgi:phenylacetate-CoA ligase
LQENNLHLGKARPKAVVVTGEPLLPHQRELIENVLQCRVFNEYGCAEFGPVAYECPQGRLHINAENVFVEIDRDADGHGRGNLVMTELNNLGMPMIRYRMGDVGVLSGEPCDCGRGLPVLEEISGRSLDFIQTGDGKKVHGMYFEYLPKYFIGEIRQFQIVQEELPRVTVRVLKDAEFNESTLTRFEEKLREVIGHDIGIDFDIESAVFREATGKHRMVVSKLPT